MKRSPQLRLLILILLACPAFSQAFRVDPQSVQTVAGNVPPGALAPVFAVPGANISLCSDAGCTVPVQSYTGISAATQCPINAAVTLPGSAFCQPSTGPQGQFGFWLTSGTYYYRITLPSGQTSPVYAITVGSTGSVTWASITGKPWIQPNVDPTGVVDATALINAAIQTCPVGTGSNTDLGYPTGSGCVVYLPEGQFKLSSALLINKDAVWFRGAGGGATQLIQTGVNQDCVDVVTPIGNILHDDAVTDISCISTVGGTNNWAVQFVGQFFNPKIFNFRSVDFYNGVRMLDGVTFHIHDFDIRHLGAGGIAIDVDSATSSGSAGGNIDNGEISCAGSGSASIGIEISASGGTWVDAVDTGECGKGLLINPYGGRTVEFLFIGRLSNDSSFGANAYIVPNGSTSVVRSIQFNGTWFASTGGPGAAAPFDGVFIGLTGGAVSTNIQGIWFDSCRFYNNAQNGIDIEAGTDIDISNSRFAGNARDDVLVGSGVTRWSLKDSVLGGTTDGFSDLEVHNLEVLGGNSNYYTVTGNRFQTAIGTGTVNTSGTAVTAVSVTRAFNGAMGNNTLIINGVAYLVAGVSDGTHLTLTSSAGTQSGVSYFYNATVLDGTTPTSSSVNTVGNNIATQEVICPTLNSVASLPSLPSYETCIFVAGTTPLTSISAGGVTWQNRLLTLIFTASAPVGITGGSGNIANTAGAVQYTPMSCLYQAETLNWYCSGGGSASSVDWVNGVTRKPIFDVRSFGAQCVGAGDDTSSIQSAVTAAQTAGGGEVKLPPGQCEVSQITVTGANIWLHGTMGQYYGTGPTRVSLTTGSGLSAFVWTGSGFATVNNHMSDMLIDGTNVIATMGYGISVANQQLFVGENLKVYNVNSGIQLATCYFCVLRDPGILGLQPITGVGIGITGPGLQEIYNPNINGTNTPCGYTCEPQAGVLIAQTGETKIFGGDIEHSGQCVKIAAGANQIVEFSKFFGTFCDQNGLGGWSITTTDASGVVHGLEFFGVWGSSNGGNGFETAASSTGSIAGIGVHGGQFYNNYNNGMSFGSGRDITIDSGARITKNTYSKAGTVTTVGAAVTLVTGNAFSSSMGGHPIVINSVTYTVLSINGAGNALVLTTSAGTQASPVAYTFGASSGCGIAVAAAISHVQIRGNISGVIDDIAADTGSETTNTQAYGACVNSGAGDYLDISNNTFWDNITGGLLFSATGTHNTVHDNANYNPVGPSTLTCSASPCTLPATASASPSTMYLAGGTVTGVTLGGATVCTASPCAVTLAAEQQIIVTYSGVPTTITWAVR